jgi:Na+/proline symporter
MTALDWIVLSATTVFIVLWGILRYRGARTMDGYLRSGNTLRWPTIGLSVMATQASAITFLSVPGQAYEDGMRFIQFYFGLPLAMIVVSAVFVPIYYRLKVYTAYEYLESRFDLKVRLLGASLFMVSRGLAAGITIYAPSIVLSALLGWPLHLTNIGIGIAVVLYTVVGGSKAVSQTQKQQMIVVLAGLIATGFVAYGRLPSGVGIDHAVSIAGALGRVNAVDASFAVTDRYNLWSGLTGGFFLALAYFGTDQSQVGRYLGGQSITQSRLGLLFNGMFKIPMQSGILFLGVLVFVFHVFVAPPVFWNGPTLEAARASADGPQIALIEARWAGDVEARRQAAMAFVAARDAGDAIAEDAARARLAEAQTRMDETRKSAKAAISAAVPRAETKDADYIFLSFALANLPAGLLGLLVAVILAAAMSSVAAELSALGSTTTIDYYQRVFRPNADRQRSVHASKLFTFGWGMIAVAFATFASLMENLIQAVNILGSIFYGTVLGIFMVAFFVKRVGATAVFWAAVVTEACVIGCFVFTDIGYLWFNVIGCLGVVTLGILLEAAGISRHRQ